MPRFELGTSSLPRRHTTGLCHIGNAHHGGPLHSIHNQGAYAAGPLRHCASLMWGS
jgi:hypothetical protein